MIGLTNQDPFPGHDTPKPKLLDTVRAAVRVRHLALSTEKVYVHWIRRSILFHNKRHPSEIGQQQGV